MCLGQATNSRAKRIAIRFSVSFLLRSSVQLISGATTAVLGSMVWVLKRPHCHIPLRRERTLRRLYQQLTSQPQHCEEKPVPTGEHRVAGPSTSAPDAARARRSGHNPPRTPPDPTDMIDAGGSGAGQSSRGCSRHLSQLRRGRQAAEHRRAGRRPELHAAVHLLGAVGRVELLAVGVPRVDVPGQPLASALGG